MARIDTIIVGYDGREEGRDAVALAHLIARVMDAKLILAAVFPYSPSQMGMEAYRQALAEDRQSLLAPVLETLEDITAEGLALGDRSPARALEGLIAEARADLVVLGSTSRGALGRITPGSVAERLLHGAACPVAVAPRGWSASDAGLRVLAVGFDASPESRQALALATELAERASATVRVIGIVQGTPTGAARGGDAGVSGDPNVRRELRDALHEAVAELPSELRAQPVVAHGDAASELAAKAEEGVDLIVLGSRGYGPLRRVVLGSVSTELIRIAPCPVLVVPRAGSESEPGDRRS
jgi:nucleotide-binding universal stress UspA family protein